MPSHESYETLLRVASKDLKIELAEEVLNFVKEKIEKEQK